MIDLFCQEHSIGLSYQAQRGVSILLMVDQGSYQLSAISQVKGKIEVTKRKSLLPSSVGMITVAVNEYGFETRVLADS